MAKIASLFLPLAGIGLVAMLIIHVATLFGATYPFDHYLKYLVPGLFVVWLPTVLISARLSRDFKQKDFWRGALRGCPKWMTKTVWIVFGYAWVGFFALPFLYGGGMGLPANNMRSMSAVLLAFYSVATSLLYSATRAERIDISRRCLNGHRVPPSAKFCEECGAAVQENSAILGDSI